MIKISKNGIFKFAFAFITAYFARAIEAASFEMELL